MSWLVAPSDPRNPTTMTALTRQLSQLETMERVYTLLANGRQIKNVVKSSTLLAARQHTRFKHIRTVLRALGQVTSNLLENKEIS